MTLNRLKEANPDVYTSVAINYLDKSNNEKRLWSTISTTFAKPFMICFSTVRHSCRCERGSGAAPNAFILKGAGWGMGSVLSDRRAWHGSERIFGS
jgi:hypothetical protein